MFSFDKFIAEDLDAAKPFDDLVKLVTLVARGVRKALFVYGTGGTGKTYTVTETLNSLGLKQNKDWYIFAGKSTIAALYKELFILRNNKIVVLDDMDDAWNNPDSTALLKAALDTQTRSLTWLSSRTANVSTLSDEQKEAFNRTVDHQIAERPNDDTIKFPSEFVFNSRVIFISNLDASKMNSAVLTRVLKINMSLNDASMFKRMAYLIRQGKLGPEGMAVGEKLDVLNTLIRLYNTHGLKNPSLRTFVSAAALKHSGEKNWTSLLKYA